MFLSSAIIDLKYHTHKDSELITAGLVAIVGNFLFGNATSITELLNSRIFIGFAHPSHTAGTMITLAFCTFALGGLVMGVIIRLVTKSRFLIMTGYWIAGAALLCALYIPHLTSITVFILL